LIYFLTSSLPLFLFIDTSTTQIYTLSLHDALPISQRSMISLGNFGGCLGGSSPKSISSSSSKDNRAARTDFGLIGQSSSSSSSRDRKSTRLNSSHVSISYAVFCLKKKKKDINNR